MKKAHVLFCLSFAILGLNLWADKDKLDPRPVNSLLEDYTPNLYKFQLVSDSESPKITFVSSTPSYDYGKESQTPNLFLNLYNSLDVSTEGVKFGIAFQTHYENRVDNQGVTTFSLLITNETKVPIKIDYRAVQIIRNNQYVGLVPSEPFLAPIILPNISARQNYRFSELVFPIAWLYGPREVPRGTYEFTDYDHDKRFRVFVPMEIGDQVHYADFEIKIVGVQQVRELNPLGLEPTNE